MFLKDNILVPDWANLFSNLYCGFTLPFYGNQALTRDSISFNRNLQQNRELLAEKTGTTLERIFSPHQIHSDIILYVDENRVGNGAFSLANAIEGDACYTDIKDVLLLVTWADCIPVILFEKDMQLAAAIHSGWRGTKDNIVINTVKKIIDRGGKLSNLYAAIGPGIKDCCYQIGDDVAGYFNNDEYSQFLKVRVKNYFLDLQSVVFKQLLSSGIKIENIDNYGVCNCCDKNNHFFSCRRDGKDYFEGQAAFIIIK